MPKWEKIGRIFYVDKNNEWMHSHASSVIPVQIEGDIYRLYFATRNTKGQGLIAYIEIDITQPTKILNICQAPVLTKGELGAFDDSGVWTGSIVTQENGDLWLYYVGWNLGVTVPFRTSIGLAVSKDGGKTFKRLFKGPILDRTKEEPHLTAACCVRKENERFKIWYPACKKWVMREGKPLHYYHIRYAESEDGINWNRQGIVAIDFKDEYEYAIGRPSIIKDKGIYKMWFPSRATKTIPTYRIRYAESEDGIHWIRKDAEAGIDVSPEGWDSEMICYPYVFKHNEDVYMFYNGNGFGKTGFGLAKLTSWE